LVLIEDLIKLFVNLLRYFKRSLWRSCYKW